MRTRINMWGSRIDYNTKSKPVFFNDIITKFSKSNVSVVEMYKKYIKNNSFYISGHQVLRVLLKNKMKVKVPFQYRFTVMYFSIIDISSQARLQKKQFSILYSILFKCWTGGLENTVETFYCPMLRFYQMLLREIHRYIYVLSIYTLDSLSRRGYPFLFGIS